MWWEVDKLSKKQRGARGKKPFAKAGIYSNEQLSR